MPKKTKEEVAKYIQQEWQLRLGGNPQIDPNDQCCVIGPESVMNPENAKKFTQLVKDLTKVLTQQNMRIRWSKVGSKVKATVQGGSDQPAAGHKKSDARRKPPQSAGDSSWRLMELLKQLKLGEASGFVGMPKRKDR